MPAGPEGPLPEGAPDHTQNFAVVVGCYEQMSAKAPMVTHGPVSGPCLQSLLLAQQFLHRPLGCAEASTDGGPDTDARHGTRDGTNDNAAADDGNGPG